MLKTYCLARPLRLEGILLEAIFGDSYSITFADGLCLRYVQQNNLNLLHKMLPTYDESLNE